MASSAGIGLSTQRRGLRVAVRAAEPTANQRRLVRGNCPDDRKEFPDSRSSQESFPRCSPARSMRRTEARRRCALPAEPRAVVVAFLRHDGIYRSDGVRSKSSKAGAGIPPPVGRPRAQLKGRDGRSAPYPSSAMSSGRLFLDRVARQQSPSPLHRHRQNNTHSPQAQAKDDISTLPDKRHFYFALTVDCAAIDWAISVELSFTPAPKRQVGNLPHVAQALTCDSLA
jgi:hypothetical protein